jgi:anti-sigma factor RsiW
MKCAEIAELVTEYLEGKLSFADRAMFLMHIAVCPPCKRYVRQMELTVRTLGKLPPLEIPDDVHAELMKSFKDWKGRNQEQRPS